MKISELKLKDKITIQDRVNVIEETVKACFGVDRDMNVVYRPYFRDFIFVANCLFNFFDEDGYEVDEEEAEDDICDYIHADENAEIGSRFYTLLNTSGLLEFLNKAIDEKISFEKQRIINVEQNVVMNMIADKLFDITCKEEIRVQKEIQALDRMNALAGSAEQQLAFQEEVNRLIPAEKQAELTMKMGENGFDLDGVVDYTLKEMIENGVLDKQTRELIDIKNQEIVDKTAQIIDLQERFAQANKE